MLEQWRPLARDGADLPATASRLGPARLAQVGAGMTFDYAFTPVTPGKLTLEVDALRTRTETAMKRSKP